MTDFTDLAVVPNVVNAYVMGKVWKKSAVFNSGLVMESDVLVPKQGVKIGMPSWTGFRGNSNVLSGSGSSCQDPSDVGSINQTAAILHRGKVWAMNDVASAAAGSNPIDASAEHIAAYWAREIDRLALTSAVGAALGIQADGSFTVVNDISGATGNNAKISASAMINTQALAGEYTDEFNVVVMHSAVRAALQILNLTSLIPDSEGGLIETFQGMRVIVDNAVTTAGSGNYYTIIARPGAFGYADGTDSRKVLEFDRDVKCNTDLLGTQKRFVIHPMGASFDGTPSAPTASDAELLTASNWSAGFVDGAEFGFRILKSKI